MNPSTNTPPPATPKEREPRAEWITLTAVILEGLLHNTTPETATPPTRKLITSSLRELHPYRTLIEADLDRLGLPKPEQVFGYFDRMTRAAAPPFPDRRLS